jgi:hypothetical protein
MDRRNKSNSPTDRANRRGCFIVAAVLLLVVAAIAFVGFSGESIDDFKSSIPVLGGLAVGFPRGDVDQIHRAVRLAESKMPGGECSQCSH